MLPLQPKLDPSFTRFLKRSYVPPNLLQAIAWTLQNPVQILTQIENFIPESNWLISHHAIPNFHQPLHWKICLLIIKVPNAPCHPVSKSIYSSNAIIVWDKYHCRRTVYLKGHGTRKLPGTRDSLKPPVYTYENTTFPQVLWRAVNIGRVPHLRSVFFISMQFSLKSAK